MLNVVYLHEFYPYSPLDEVPPSITDRSPIDDFISFLGRGHCTDLIRPLGHLTGPHGHFRTPHGHCKDTSLDLIGPHGHCKDTSSDLMDTPQTLQGHPIRPHGHLTGPLGHCKDLTQHTRTSCTRQTPLQTLQAKPSCCAYAQQDVLAITSHLAHI
jgi:hypothetical protein